MIVAFEGIDGSGKATQSKLAAQKLNTTLISFPRYNVEPMGPSIARELRDPKLSPADFQALMLADKYGAAPEIKEIEWGGKNVVLDRYWISGRVYGAVDGVDAGWLWRTHTSLPQPDVWILIDVPVAASVARRPERRDHYEKNLDKLELVRAEYLEIFSAQASISKYSKSNSKKWNIVRGDRSVEEVHADVMDIVRR